MSTKLKTDNSINQNMIDLANIFSDIPTTDDTLPIEIKNLIENVS
jgi:hypothetical protein